MPVSSENLSAASEARPPLAPYLQAVAAALAAPGANVERVLQAAQARAVERGGNSAQFRTPDPRFRFATVSFGSGPDHPLKSVLFVCDESRGAVSLGELVAAFGSWQRATAGSSLSDTYPIVFGLPYPPSAPEDRRRTAETRVRVSFTADPATPSARALEITLLRFELDQ